MSVGNSHDSLREVNQNVGDSFAAGIQSRTLHKGDAKANALFPSKTASQKAILNGKLPKLSIVAAGARLNKIISSVKSFFTQKLNLNNKSKTSPKQQFLQSFEEQVLPTTRNKKAALEATLTALENAEKEGILDKTLYTAVTRRLEKSLSRQSIVLDDEQEAPNLHKEIRTSREEVPGALLQKLESFEPGFYRKNSEVDEKTCRELVSNALKNYPPHNEVTLNSHTTIYLPNAKGGPDILIKKEQIGAGAASTVFKAYSLSQQKYVVVKYPAELNSTPASSKDALDALGDHNHIQKTMEQYTIETQGGPKKITVDEYYEKGAAEEGISKENFIDEYLALPENPTDDQIKAGVQAMNQKLVRKFTEPAPKDEKLALLVDFREYVSEILPQETVNRLADAYRALIEQHS